MSDNELQPGESLTVYVSDLQPNSAIEIWVHSEPRLLQTATADAGGEAQVEVTIPDDLEPGQHWINVRGTAVSGSPAVVELPVVVRDPPSLLDSLLMVGLLTLLVGGVGLIGLVLWRHQRTRRRTRRGY